MQYTYSTVPATFGRQMIIHSYSVLYITPPQLYSYADSTQTSTHAELFEFLEIVRSRMVRSRRYMEGVEHFGYLVSPKIWRWFVQHVGEHCFGAE